MPNSAQQNRENIWQVVSQIPKGKVTSYGQVATLAGLPGAARLVGNVLSKLPKGSQLPWHRVINSQGKISFAEGSSRYLRQKERLEAEGIAVNKGKIALPLFGWPAP